MMFRIISIIAVIGLLSTTSCMQDHPDLVDASKEIKVSAFIDDASNLGVKTRVSDNTWNKDDAIGIFMKNTGEDLSENALALNNKYINTDASNSFKPAPSDVINFPFHEEKVDFIAYYPYFESINDFTYEVNVSDQTDLAKIDLLYSNNVNDINSLTQNVDLLFEHQLSKVVLNISIEAGGPELTGLNVGIRNVNTKAAFSLIDGKLTDTQDSTSISFNINVIGNRAEAILLPITNFTDEKLVFTIGEFSYSYNLKENKQITSFNKSTQYTFNVLLKPGAGVIVESVTSSIQDWTVVKAEESITANEDKKENQNQQENDSPANLPNDKNDEVNYSGDGTKENPYSVEQAQINKGETKKWVMGYIVGYPGTGYRRHQFVRGYENAGVSFISIASTTSESEGSKTFVIDITGSLSEKINLKNNKENFEKKILLNGDIENYNDQILMKNVNEAILEQIF